MNKLDLKTMPIQVRRMFKAYETELADIDGRVGKAKKLRDELTKEVTELKAQKVNLRSYLKQKEDELMASVENIKNDTKIANEEAYNVKNELKQQLAEAKAKISKADGDRAELRGKLDKVDASKKEYDSMIGRLKGVFEVVQKIVG